MFYKKLKFKNGGEKAGFIKGLGLGKIVKEVEKLKKIAKEKKREKTIKSKFNLIRLEMMQIKKHHKLSMRYIHELEKMIKDDVSKS